MEAIKAASDHPTKDAAVVRLLEAVEAAKAEASSPGEA
jgi:hypothetical protein